VGRLPPAGVIGCVVVAVGSGFALDLVVQARSTPNWHPIDFFHTYSAAHAILNGRPPFRAGYIDLPSLAVLLIPLTFVPKWAAYWLFTALTGAAVGVGSALFAARMGWAKPWLVGLAVVSSWTCIYGMYLGQPEGLLFADAVAAVALARRRMLFWAGITAGALLIKPTVTWPIPVFLLLSLWHERQALLTYVRGLALSAVACVALGAWVLPSWFTAAVHFSSGVGTQQTVLSLDGLLRLAPSSWGLGTGILSPGPLVILALGIGLLAWIGKAVLSTAGRDEASLILEWSVWVPVAVWLAVTPYDHTYDELFLVPLIMLVAGPDGVRLSQPQVAVSLLAAAILPATGAVGLFLSGPSLAPLGIAAFVTLGVFGFRALHLPRAIAASPPEPVSSRR
jgi:hypothetical protein